MNLLVIEVLLWIGFGLILWAMRESLVQIESDLQARASASASARRHANRIPPSHPQRLTVPIGRYDGWPIHEYALIEDRHYRFAHICPGTGAVGLAHNERWVAPGLVYVECPLPAPLAPAA